MDVFCLAVLVEFNQKGCATEWATPSSFFFVTLSLFTKYYARLTSLWKELLKGKTFISRIAFKLYSIVQSYIYMIKLFGKVTKKAGGKNGMPIFKHFQDRPPSFQSSWRVIQIIGCFPQNFNKDSPKWGDGQSELTLYLGPFKRKKKKEKKSTSYLEKFSGISLTTNNHRLWHK